MARRYVPSPRFLVLGLLMRGPQHGYELHQRYSQELGTVWHLGISRLYAVLGELERSGEVEGQVEQQESRPARKAYELTAAGQQSFLQWVHQPVAHLRDIRLLFLAKLYFLGQFGLEGAEELIGAQRELLLARLQGMSERSAELSVEDFADLVTGYRRHQLEATIAWLDELKEQINP